MLLSNSTCLSMCPDGTFANYSTGTCDGKRESNKLLNDAHPCLLPKRVMPTAQHVKTNLLTAHHVMRKTISHRESSNHANLAFPIALPVTDLSKTSVFPASQATFKTATAA